MSQVVPYHLETMKFGSSMEDEDSDYLQLFFPLVVAHKIDASSPLFELSPKDLQAKQFEIILSLDLNPWFVDEDSTLGMDDRCMLGGGGQGD